jgi:hypothetical protein
MEYLCATFRQRHIRALLAQRLAFCELSGAFGRYLGSANMQRSNIVKWWPFVLTLVVGAAAVLWSQPSVADGAIAIGIPPGGVVKGYAGGHSLNAADTKSARDGAVDGCHKSTGASDAAKKACAVVATFKDKCYAIALDPKDGTPGAGWGVAETQALADQQALQKCRDTAGADRQQFCEVPTTNHGCDGTAK